MQQQPVSLFMVRPVSFGFNDETAKSNSFSEKRIQQPKEVSNLALHEFDKMVDILQSHSIDVIVVEDTPEPIKPDAVFPNNWISFHHDGTIVLYPMLAPNRRVERRTDVVEMIKHSFVVSRVVDLSSYEEKDQYLEGTGSIVFDHTTRTAYACSSPRSDEKLFMEVCNTLHYKPIWFKAIDEKNVPVYHTNVVLSIGGDFAMVCLDAIRDESDQDKILDALEVSRKKVIAISYEQMKHFAGNLLEVSSREGDHYIILSQTAFQALLPGQIDALSRGAELLVIDIPTIEKFGGGSVRCMVSGIHLPKKKLVV
jgi:hypothetical protein